MCKGCYKKISDENFIQDSIPQVSYSKIPCRARVSKYSRLLVTMIRSFQAFLTRPVRDISLFMGNFCFYFVCIWGTFAHQCDYHASNNVLNPMEAQILTLKDILLHLITLLIRFWWNLTSWFRPHHIIRVPDPPDNIKIPS